MQWIICEGVYTWCDLIQPDVYVVVSVSTGLLMVETHGMEQLVLDHSLVVTARPQGQNLTRLLVANTGETPGTRTVNTE